MLDVYFGTAKLLNILATTMQELGGGCRLDACTFSINERFLRWVRRKKQNRELKEIHLCIDNKSHHNLARLRGLMESTLDSYKLVENHAKAAVITSQEGKQIGIISSENMAEGRRVECTIRLDDLQAIEKIANGIEELRNEQGSSTTDTRTGLQFHSHI